MSGPATAQGAIASGRELTERDWKFFERAVGLLILASLLMGTGVGLTLSAVWFMASALRADNSVQSLASRFLVLGPGLMIAGAAILGGIVSVAARRCRRRSAAQQHDG